MKAFVISVAIAAAVFSASPAQADADTYLARLSANGVNPIGTMTPGNLVAGGLQMCNLMRAGMSPEQAAGSLGILAGVLGGPAVDAAQHELCPDTLTTPNGDPAP
jgi:hypothetical protein